MSSDIRDVRLEASEIKHLAYVCMYVYERIYYCFCFWSYFLPLLCKFPSRYISHFIESRVHCTCLRFTVLQSKISLFERCYFSFSNERCN